MRSMIEAIKDAINEGWIFELEVERTDCDAPGYDKSTAIIYNAEDPYGSCTDRSTGDAVLVALRMHLEGEIVPAAEDAPIIKQMDWLARRHRKIRITSKGGQVTVLLNQILECPKNVSGPTLEEALSKAK